MKSGKAATVRSVINVATPQARSVGFARYAIAFLLPLTGLVKIGFVGTLYLHDILTPILLVGLLFFSGNETSLRPLRTALWLILIWLLGAMVTDLIQVTPFEDYSRGWSRIILLGMNIITFWLLSKGRMSVLIAYVAGLGVQSLLLPLFATEEDFGVNEPWKFGIGAGLAILGAATASIPRIATTFGPKLPALYLAGIAALSLWYNGRSLFAIFALSSACVLLMDFVSRRPRITQRINRVSFTLMALAGIFATQVLTAVYSFFASSGLLGDAALQKYLNQSQADVNLLVGGRPESLVSIQAIIDSPIIGHGSWARDQHYTFLLVSRMQEVGLYADAQGVLRGEGLIPTHSHLFGAWVEAGIAGAPMWLWAIFLSAAVLFALFKSGKAPDALVVLTAFLVFWDVLFSPFAATARFQKAGQICLLIAALGAYRPAVSARLANVGGAIRQRARPPWRHSAARFR